MKVDLARPFTGMHGTYKGSSLTYFKRNGQQYARAAAEPTGTSSEEQDKIQAYMSAASKAWRELSDTQRDTWQRYAERYQKRNARGELTTPWGVNAFTAANVTRQILGLDLISELTSVEQPPPLRAAWLEQLRDQPPDTIGIIVYHHHVTTEGLYLLVRATPATKSPARKPQENDLRHVCGVGPQSAAPLQASRSEYRFSPSRFLLQEGERYGVEVRIVRAADGSMSHPTHSDFLKSVGTSLRSAVQGELVTGVLEVRDDRR